MNTFRRVRPTEPGFQNVAQVHRSFAVETDMPGVERHPAERLAATVFQPALFLCLAGLFIRAANPLDRMECKSNSSAGKPRQALQDGHLSRHFHRVLKVCLWASLQKFQTNETALAAD
jgi:hypothetical protein